MTSKTITKKQTVCDECGSDECYGKCLLCGKDVCYRCRKTKGIEYTHAVHFSGSGEGYYCTACDLKANDDLHSAYQAIARLKQEARLWDKDF